MPPFQHNFLDLFEGLGLDISEPIEKDKSEDSPDFSYDIEVFALSLTPHSPEFQTFSPLELHEYQRY